METPTLKGDGFLRFSRRTLWLSLSGILPALNGPAYAGLSSTAEQPRSIPPASRLNTSTISVNEFGALGDGVTDDSVSLQAALDYAKETHKSVYIPAGRYRITRGLVFRTEKTPNERFNQGLRLFGDGPKASAIIVACAGPGLTTDSTSMTADAHTHHYDLGFHLSDIAIQGDHPESIGWATAAQWYGQAERVVISGHGRHGIVFLKKNYNIDFYAMTGLRLISSMVFQNGGWGLNMEAGQAGILTRIERCYIVDNIEGGIRTNGAGLELLYSAVAGNGRRRNGVNSGGGLHICYFGDHEPNDFFRVEGCEFDDNFGFHLRIDYCSTGLIRSNRFLANVVTPSTEPSFVTPTVGLWIAQQRSLVRSLEIRQNMWMAVNNVAGVNLTHEMMRNDKAQQHDHGILIAGSAYRWHKDSVLNEHINIFTDDEVTSEWFSLPAGGTLRLRPINYQGVARFKAGAQRDSYALFTYRCNDTPVCTPVGFPVGSNIHLTTGALTGMSGPDGKITISAAPDGCIYMENRMRTLLNDWSLRTKQ